MKNRYLYLLLIFNFTTAFAQTKTKTRKTYMLKPDRVFDGTQMHNNWWVAVTGNRIAAVGEASAIQTPSGAIVVELKGTTLMPGMIEGHSHMYLHPYNETVWNDQVLIESRAERTARAVNHVKETLLAGFTSARDLGTEGAMYDDVGLKEAIQKGIIIGQGYRWLPAQSSLQAATAPRALTIKPRKASPKVPKRPMVWMV